MKFHVMEHTGIRIQALAAREVELVVARNKEHHNDQGALTIPVIWL